MLHPLATPSPICPTTIRPSFRSQHFDASIESPFHDSKWNGPIATGPKIMSGSGSPEARTTGVARTIVKGALKEMESRQKHTRNRPEVPLPNSAHTFAPKDNMFKRIDGELHQKNPPQYTHCYVDIMKTAESQGAKKINNFATGGRKPCPFPIENISTSYYLEDLLR